MNRPVLRWIALAIVAAAVAGNAIVLAPELTVGRVDLNDEVFHYTIIDSIVARLTHGHTALEFWMPEWSLGYPVLRAYQPLGAWFVAAVQIATGQHFPLDSTFALVRYLLLVAFPITAYAASRLLDFDELTSAAVALVSPLVASPNLYGLEFGSYVWRGDGLFTQLVAMHLFVLAIGFGARAIRTGRRLTLAGLLVALTILAHLI
ncbi:MAG TPA: hypothetical protein VLU46_05530, partial [Thermoanaerobaculia bacterium]|nr:hypothetical protein [Thermoanaerobaculia bacterium]